MIPTEHYLHNPLSAAHRSRSRLLPVADCGFSAYDVADLMKPAGAMPQSFCTGQEHGPHLPDARRDWSIAFYTGPLTLLASLDNRFEFDVKGQTEETVRMLADSAFNSPAVHSVYVYDSNQAHAYVRIGY